MSRRQCGSPTAFANDVSYDDVFVGQLGTFLRPGDLVIGFKAQEAVRMY